MVYDLSSYTALIVNGSKTYATPEYNSNMENERRTLGAYMRGLYYL